MNYRELQAEAKRLGINSHGKKQDELARLVEHAASMSDEPETPVHPHIQHVGDITGNSGTVVEPSAMRGDRPTERPDPSPRGRIPLGTPRQKLTYPSREGYVRRWLNDQRNRIHDAELAGYQFVEEEQDGRQVKVSRLVGSKEDGSPMMAYLMEIRQEFYDADQAEKQKPIDEFDAQLRRGLSNPEDIAAEDRGKMYTPSEGTTLRHGN